VQLAASRACVTLDESVIIVFHPAPDGNIDLMDLDKKRHDMINALAEGRNILILNDVEQMPRQTAQYLISQGMSGDTRGIVCENLSLEDEKIFTGTLKDIVDMDFSWQSVTVVKK